MTKSSRPRPSVATVGSACSRVHRLVVAGALAQRPRAAGHAWVFLQYLLGFRRLGFETLFVDRMPGDAAYLEAVMRRFQLPYALLDEQGRSAAGLSDDDVASHVQGATVLNVMGYLQDERLLELAGQRVFVDIDPGFPQMWRALELADVFAGHDRFVTVGQNIGRVDCEIPACALDWIASPPPVVLDEWPVRAGGARFTTVASWRGAFGPIEYQGKTYGLRVHEFRRFRELPRLVEEVFELALEVDPAETRDLELLGENGWHLVDPRRVAADPDAYRNYLQRSKAELMIAKNMYVESRSGWFSDRSASTGLPLAR